MRDDSADPALNGGWVTGPALELAIKLKALQCGDEVLWVTTAPGPRHYYYGVVGYHGSAYWNQGSNFSGINISTPAIAGAVQFKQVYGWKPIQR